MNAMAYSLRERASFGDHAFDLVGPEGAVVGRVVRRGHFLRQLATVLGAFGLVIGVIAGIAWNADAGAPWGLPALLAAVCLAVWGLYRLAPVRELVVTIPDAPALRLVPRRRFGRPTRRFDVSRGGVACGRVDLTRTFVAGELTVRWADGRREVLCIVQRGCIAAVTTREGEPPALDEIGALLGLVRTEVLPRTVV